MGTGFAVGPYISGGFMDIYGVRAVWILTFVLSIGASCLMMILQVFERFNSKKLLEGGYKQGPKA